MYGEGAPRLAQQLRMQVADAAALIKSFMQCFSGVGACSAAGDVLCVSPLQSLRIRLLSSLHQLLTLDTLPSITWQDDTVVPRWQSVRVQPCASRHRCTWPGKKDTWRAVSDGSFKCGLTEQVKKFTEDAKAAARARGEVCTMSGRRRPLRGFTSADRRQVLCCRLRLRIPRSTVSFGLQAQRLPIAGRHLD